MLLAVIVAWLVVVLTATTWTAVRGRRLWLAARTAQSDIERHVINAELAQLPERMAELEQRQARLAEAMARLQASVAEFKVLWNAIAPVVGLVTGTRAFFTSK